MRKINCLLSTILMALVFFTSACKNKPVPEDEKRTIKLIYTNWSESIALTQLAAELLEQKMGYEVSTKLTNVKEAYNQVANSEFDVFMDAWLPRTHEHYFDPLKDQLIDLGVNYKNAKLGLVVPEYSKLMNIADLKNYQGSIVGIDPEAGVMKNTLEAIDKYKLTINLDTLNGPEMTKKLEEALKRNNEIVVTGWLPHWAFARYELRFLSDPLEIYGQEEQIHTIARISFDEEHPVATEFFKRMKLSNDQINNLMYEIQVEADPLIGVKKWIKKNEFVVNQWTRDLSKERKKVM